MRNVRHSERRFKDRCRGALRGLIVAAPLAMGGAHLVVNLALATGLLLLLLGFCTRGTREKTLSVELPAVLMAAALLLTLAQVIPLPPALLGFLSPEAGAIWEMALGESLRWGRLSVDPVATWHEVVKLISYLCVGVLAGTFFRKSRHRLELIETLVWAGAGVTLIGFFHMVLGQEQAFGHFGRETLFPSTLINPNHLAGFLGFTSLLGVGLGLKKRGNVRWLYLGISMFSGAGVFLTLSRGGILAFLCVCFLFAVVWSLREPKATFRVMGCLAGGTLLGAALLASMVGYRPIVQELWTLGKAGRMEKVDLWGVVPGLLREFPLFGIGRGAFESLGPRYFNSPHHTWTHLENEWLQTLVDWGPVLGGGILLLGLLCLFGVLLRVQRIPEHLAAVMGILFLGLQNLVDFSFQVTGIAVPAVALLSSLMALPSSTGTTAFWESSYRLSRLGVARGAVALLLVVVIAGHGSYGKSISEDLNALRTLTEDRTIPSHRVEARALELVEHHPASFYVPLLMSRYASRGGAGTQSGLTWVNRAMFLNPFSYNAHLFAGRILWRMDVRPQAILEYRLATERRPWRTLRIAEELSRLSKGDLSFARDLAGKNSGARIAIGRFLLNRGEPSLALEVLGAVPLSPSLQWYQQVVRAYRILKDPTRAWSWYEEMKRVHTRAAESYLVGVGLLLREKDFPRVEALLEEGIKASRKPFTLLARRAEILLGQGRHREVREQLVVLQKGGGTPPERARVSALFGRLERALGERVEASRYYERAIAHAPRASYFRSLLTLREELEDYEGALLVLSSAEGVLDGKVLKRERRRLEGRRREHEAALKRAFYLNRAQGSP